LKVKSAKGQRFLWNCHRRILAPELGLLCVLLALPGLLAAQNSRAGSDTLATRGGDTLRLAHPYLVPGGETVKLGNRLLAIEDYQIDYQRGTLMLRDSALRADTSALVVQYRYFPDILSERLALRSFRLRSDTSGAGGIQVEEYYKGEERVLISPSTVQRSGSISRGISVGNNQNLSVSSGLRLQLEGDLGDDLKLQAAITDESIPIQPDGTTQQINDFDKVFIQLLRRDDRVILGDFEINHTGTNFANFYRNVQGIGFYIQEKGFNASLNGAVAKGKFHSNSFQGREGVQGPYRLLGKNQERFIIVLAGSEKVYLNGQLVTRGEGNDYVMDYNTGELTFTAQRVITSASRIVVDFEYTDRNYNRSLFFTEFGAKALKDKLVIKGSYGRDADNQNAPIEGEYSQEELDTLRNAGDVTFAAVSGIDSVGPPDNETGIHYARLDTLFNGVLYERYAFSVDPATALYRLAFSEVGQGAGMYVKAQNLVNGTVYNWVGPDSSGVPKGNFSPIRVLIPAKLYQVADVQATYKITDKLSAYTELAVSTEDRNRHSPVGDGDNNDLANKTGIRLEKLKLSDSLELKIDLSHRYIGERYNNIDRVYKVEYGREWNFNDLGQRLTENVSEAAVDLRYGSRLRLSSAAGYRTFGTDLRSFKQTFEAESRHKILQGKYTFTTISTTNSTLGTFSRWNRHNGDIYKQVKGWTPGSEIWIEDRSDELVGAPQKGAFRFYDLKPYLKSKEGGKFGMHIYYNYRQEFEVLDSVEREKSVAHTEYLKLTWSPSSAWNFQNTSSLRQFEVRDTAFYSQGISDNQSIITNLQGSWNSKNQIVFANLIYEVTQEQIARKQVAYLQVNPGQGDYEWIDADSNGIQGLDEFQYSVNPNRQNFFVRILAPTTELFPTTALNFSGNVKIDFKKAIKRSDNPFKETFRNTSAITNFRVVQKKEDGNSIQSYLVNLNNVFGDTALLDAQYNLRQDLYFFRNNPKGDLKFSFGDNQSKLFLASGDELRSQRYYSADQRVNFGKDKSLENEFKIGTRASLARAFDSRNYNIAFYELKPKLNLQISRKLRLSVGYEYKHKENTNDSSRVDAVINMHKAIFDAKLNLKDRNNIFAKVELVQVGQTGKSSFSAEYEMRESLQPGFNAIWQVFSTIYLSKSLELGLTYDGRASESTKVLHTGRVQLKAFF
jgi:hypothetical protein